jgi:hypothetical protein
MWGGCSFASFPEPLHLGETPFLGATLRVLDLLDLASFVQWSMLRRRRLAASVR